jgi:hypothetical protein
MKLAVVAVVRSLVHTPQLAPCAQRYASGIVFSLEQNGVLLTSTDLQTRLSGKDVGLGDNVQIAASRMGRRRLRSASHWPRAPSPHTLTLPPRAA